MVEEAMEEAALTGQPAAGKESLGTDAKKKRRKGILARTWNVIFRGRGEDYEKKLQHLSKEEAAVHERMKRRAQRWRGTARNIILFSVLSEVIATAYAVATTRSVELTWQMRAKRVLPMFVLPFFSSIVYYMFSSLMRMLDNRDQRMLEKLRAERQAKIDELKEITNYYNTQQLIQRYDLDPAAKAAAATILASKLGTDTGLKVYVADDSSPPTGKSNDVELVQSDGLRNRKHSQVRSQSIGGSTVQQFANEITPEPAPGGQEGLVVEHFKGPGNTGGGWIARIAAMLVGEDPTQCYALICGNCHMHNGLARKEDFPHINYYCPHCHALNGSRQSEGSNSGSRPRRSEEPISSSSAGKMSPVAEGSESSDLVRNLSSTSSAAAGEVTS